MSERPRVVRSYQRVFTPDRRIYAVDGRTIPVPGGVPLRWLATATIVLLAGLLLAAVRPAVVLALGAITGTVVLRFGRPRHALVAFAAAAVGSVVVGLILRSLDWPLRLVVIPAVLATVATQLAPDGRSAHRFLGSWLRAQVAGRRRLGRALPAAGERGVLGGRVRVAPDCHAPDLLRARITGPGVIHLTRPAVVTRRRGGRRTIRPLASRRGGVMLDRIDLTDGEQLEVRP